ERVMYIHLTLLPWVPTAGELKTKPTQHSVKELLSVGIQPDLLVCRSGDKEIPVNERRKIALFCNVKPERVIEARDVDTIYHVPIAYHDQGFDREVCRYFGLDADDEPNLDRWRGVVRSVREPEGKVTIAVVGKYTVLLDAYKSLSEALTHGGFGSNVKVGLEWMDSEIFERDDAVSHLEHVNGILVPGGFGELGAYPAHLRRGTKVHEIYEQDVISERHRHRYEVNVNYKDRLEQVGLRFSGMSPDGILPEIVEIPDHPWFIGVQYHPELKSRS